MTRFLTAMASALALMTTPTLAQERLTLASPAPGPARINAFLTDWATAVSADSNGALDINDQVEEQEQEQETESGDDDAVGCNGAAVTVSKQVHAFYYPWYGNPATDGAYKHWNHEFIPHWDKRIAKKYKSGKHDPTHNDVAAAFFPRLGVSLR